MQRAIVGFHQDAHGDWVAELACGHRRHVRHRPPFQQLPWVVDEAGRRARLGTLLDCGLCARAVPAPVTSGDQGGEPPCLATLVCDECGALLDDGPHRPGCASPR